MLRETPKRIVNTPNAATHHNIFTPARRPSGRWASTMAMVAAPMAGAQRKRPRPQGSGFQNVARIHRQQRHRAAEQHGEEVQRNRAQHHFFSRM